MCCIGGTVDDDGYSVFRRHRGLFRFLAQSLKGEGMSLMSILCVIVWSFTHIIHDRAGVDVVG